MTFSIFILSSSQYIEIRKLQEEFKDLFEDVQGLPPKRAVEHEIQLVGRFSSTKFGFVSHFFNRI